MHTHSRMHKISNKLKVKSEYRLWNCPHYVIYHKSVTVWQESVKWINCYSVFVLPFVMAYFLLDQLVKSVVEIAILRCKNKIL